MKNTARIPGRNILLFAFLLLSISLNAQTPAFPGADGFGRFATGARGAATPQVYIVTNLNDAGPGSFRDAVSQPGRFVVFAVGGIIYLQSDIVVSPNTTIAGQTAPGDGIVLFNKRVTFSGASNTICRFLRIRLGATTNSGKDATGIANGANMIFDHLSVTWGMDEVFSINWDGKNTAPDNITIQNSIIGQGLHRENHSAGGLIQTPDGGKVSLIRNLYISNKTRNPKVKGGNEFVNNVVYNWGNGNRLGDNLNYGWSGDAYIMGGSAGVSEVNIINNYFTGGPLTPPSKTTPFSRGTGTFFLYGAGNYFDNNTDGVLNGTLVPYDTTGYPGIAAEGFRTQPFPYPLATPAMTAQQAYQWVTDSVGAMYPRRDQVDALLADEVRSKGTQGWYVYRETDLPFTNGGLGNVFGAPAPPDTDGDGIPDAWEDANGLNKQLPQDALQPNAGTPAYLNIEVYINSLINTAPPAFIKPPSNVTLSVDSTILVRWKDNADNETGFILERSQDGNTFIHTTTLTANDTAYTDTAGLSPNTTYFYRVKAVNETDTSIYSTPVSVRTMPLPSAPDMASQPIPANGYTYAELSGDELALKWTGSANTVEYLLYFGTHVDSLAQITSVTAPTFILTSLQNNITYYWRVDAVNDKGTTPGDTWSFRTMQVFPPGMIGHWSFDETSGRLVADSSVYQTDGVLGLDEDNDSIRVPGKINYALDFSTADEDMYVVQIPHADQLHLGRSAFSLSFWMKAAPALLPPDNNISAYLLCKGAITRNAATGATGKRFDIEFKNKQFRFAIDDDNDAGGGGKDELQADGIPFFTNEWVHVVVMRDTAAKKLRLYRNGALVKETNITKANAGIGEESALIIGNIGELEFLSTANKPAPYKGMLDELKIFNYPVSQTEILELFHTSPLPLQAYNPVVANNALLEGYEPPVRLSWQGGIRTSRYRVYMGLHPDSLTHVADAPLDTPSYVLEHPATHAQYYWRVDAEGPAGVTPGAVWTFRTVSLKGLAGHWKLDDSTGMTAKDDSPFHHDGQLNAFPQASWDTAGRFKGSLAFSDLPATEAIHIPHSDHLLFDQNSFTISLWVKIPSSAGRDCYLVHKGTFEAGTGKWYGLQLRDGKLTFAIDDGSVKTDLAITPNIFSNQWKHITAIRDASSKQLRLYVDGVLMGSKAYTTGTTGRLTSLMLGNSPENKPYRDLMDDVRLYNYALSAAEIAALRDTTPPNVITRNITVTLLDSITISPQQIDNGSTDSSGIAALYLDRSTFTCADTGTHTVTLTTEDPNGNTATATALITVKSAVPAPQITVTRQNNTYTGLDAHTIALGYGAQKVTLNAAGQYASYFWSPATGLSDTNVANPTFTPSAAGDYTFTLTVTNANGCTSQASVTIHVIDVRCGYRNRKVQLCYYGVEICVDPLAARLLFAFSPHATVAGHCPVHPGVISMKQGVTTTDENTALLVYPNPASQQVQVRFGTTGVCNYSVELFDVQGKLLKIVERGTAPGRMQFSLPVDVGQYPVGVYFVRVVLGDVVQTKRIVIQR